MTPHESKESAGGRVVSFDVIRGVAIGGMVFLHNGAFHLASITEALRDPPPWLVAFGFLLLWAGLFGVVSGAANATAILQRLDRQAAKAPQWRFPAEVTTGALQTFLILFVLHWIWTIVVGNSAVTESFDDPTLRVTLIPGLLYYGAFPRIHPENWVFASALWMIAANVLLVTLAMRWFYRAKPPRPNDGLDRYLIGLGLAALVATPILRALLFGPMQQLVESGGAAIGLAVPLALLVNDPNPVFPFVAYGLLGALGGAAVQRRAPRPRLYRRFVWIGIALVTVGGAGLGALGGLVLADREGIWGQSPLYFTSLSYVLLGVFAWLLAGLLAIIDPGPESRRTAWRPRILRACLRFGRCSLTIFLLEGILGMLLRLGLDAIAPGWNDGVPMALGFGLANVLLWHGILVAWERYDYRYSMEWCLAAIRGSEARGQALRSQGTRRMSRR